MSRVFCWFLMLCFSVVFIAGLVFIAQLSTLAASVLICVFTYGTIAIARDVVRQ